MPQKGEQPVGGGSIRICAFRAVPDVFAAIETVTWPLPALELGDTVIHGGRGSDIPAVQAQLAALVETMISLLVAAAETLQNRSCGARSAPRYCHVHTTPVHVGWIPRPSI